MKKSYIIISLIIGIAIFAIILLSINKPTANSENLIPIEQQTNTELAPLSATTTNTEVKTNPEGVKYILDPNKVLSGGPPKGGIGVDRGIPALDENNIKYQTVEEADNWIEDNELVLVINHKETKRAYPLQIMVWHEIANDVIAGDPIAITYCPLCGSGIAYYRVINNQAVKLGTSGKLYNSNLIMYDDLTDTYWQQIDGKAIIGELAGQELKELSVDTVVWRDYKSNNPEALVLSQETGMSRNYGRDPYGNYYEDSFLIFPVDNEDNRIHAKEPIVGIEVNGQYKAYREEQVRELKTIKDTVNNINIEIKSDESGIITITNLETNEEIVKERDFWFAWYAFHPDTELYQ